MLTLYPPSDLQNNLTKIHRLSQRKATPPFPVLSIIQAWDELIEVLGTFHDRRDTIKLLRTFKYASLRLSGKPSATYNANQTASDITGKSGKACLPFNKIPVPRNRETKISE